ncbi:hypothetical protein [Pseudolabrys sp. FHR47]|uniref:hypothetical protein n=1 Tax=Pseudolabrys sp. FHR47 TaxID=2562284 RepID=UPI0010BF5222|nr:hypothetical protein [Pseudolabrys sp. FHR47]
MSASEPNRSAPSLTRRNELLKRVDSAAAIAVCHETVRIALDRSLQKLREESARTMALIRDLRTSPLYRLRYRKSALLARFALDR